MTPRPDRAAPHFDSPEQEVFLSLWRTYDRLRALEEELFGRHDLTPQQYNALRLLASQHPAKLRTLDLAGRLVSRARISRACSTSWSSAASSTATGRPTTAASFTSASRNAAENCCASCANRCANAMRSSLAI